MQKRIKLKLHSVKGQQFDVTEIDVILDNSCVADIISVFPENFAGEYANQAIWTETANKGQSPVLLQALGMYNIKLPCIIAEIIECSNCSLFCNKCYYFEAERKQIPKLFYCRLHHKRTKKEGSCEQWKEIVFDNNEQK